MKSIYLTLVALIAVAAISGSVLFADDGIEVLRNDGIEVLGIEVLGIEVLGIEVLGIEVLGIEVLGIEVLGIEVLGIEVLDSGATQYVTRIHNAPAGSYVQAEMSPNGDRSILVDVAPIDPATGVAAITFPARIPGNRITVRNPDGEIVRGIGYEGQLEHD